jgi:hypothetical protein
MHASRLLSAVLLLQAQLAAELSSGAVVLERRREPFVRLPNRVGN